MNGIHFTDNLSPYINRRSLAVAVLFTIIRVSIIPIPPALIPLRTARVRMPSVAPAATTPAPAATVAVMAASSSPVSRAPTPAVLVVVLPVAARPFHGNVRLGGRGEGNVVGEVSEISIFESVRRLRRLRRFQCESVRSQCKKCHVRCTYCYTEYSLSKCSITFAVFFL